MQHAAPSRKRAQMAWASCPSAAALLNATGSSSPMHQTRMITTATSLNPSHIFTTEPAPTGGLESRNTPQVPLNEQLKRAVISGDEALSRTLLKEGADPRGEVRSGLSYLAFAA